MTPPEPPQNPCAGDPCGPNAICREVNGQPVCTCLPGYVDNPPRCRPECVVHAECPPLLACINNRCNDPCRGICGVQATCVVVNHNPICSCRQGFTGDPFIRCTLIPEKPKPPIISPPSPPTLPPVTSRPVLPPVAETTPHRDDPIIPVTGPPTTTKEPLVIHPLPPAPPTIPKAPCETDPCGANAICIPKGNRFVCQCHPDFYGDPYLVCRPECVLDSDCHIGFSCQRQKCVDPCPGFCRPSAQCSVVNHRPVCSCSPGLLSDPHTTECRVPPIASITPCKILSPLHHP